MFLDNTKFAKKPIFSQKSYWLYKLFIEFCKENKCMHILYNDGFIKEGIFDDAIENFFMLTGLTAFFEKRENIHKCLDGECNIAFERIQLWRYFLLKNYTKIPGQVRMYLGPDMWLRTMKMMREFGDRGNKKVKNVLENLNLYCINE
jgi:hypothetical protein